MRPSTVRRSITGSGRLASLSVSKILVLAQLISDEFARLEGIFQLKFYVYVCEVLSGVSCICIIAMHLASIISYSSISFPVFFLENFFDYFVIFIVLFVF